MFVFNHCMQSPSSGSFRTSGCQKRFGSGPDFFKHFSHRSILYGNCGSCQLWLTGKTVLPSFYFGSSDHFLNCFGSFSCGFYVKNSYIKSYSYKFHNVSQGNFLKYKLLFLYEF